MAIFDFINKYILSYVMRFIMSICNNQFALAILLFTIFINVIMIPLSIKSQKSSVQQTKIKPKLDELKKKYGDDKQKYSAAMQKLYQEQNVSMSGGCLPMIIRLVFLMSIYYLVTKPISYLTAVSADTINYVTSNLSGLSKLSYSAEIQVLEFIKNPANIEGITDEALRNGIQEIQAAVSGINFNFFGIDLIKTPDFSQANILWVIPFLSFAAAMLSGIVSIRLQKSVNPDAPSMGAMMLLMPLFSLYIAFKAPCSLGFYWACSSLIGGIAQAALQYFYGPYRMLAKERVKNIIKVNEQEQKHLKSFVNDND